MKSGRGGGILHSKKKLGLFHAFFFSDLYASSNPKVAEILRFLKERPLIQIKYYKEMMEREISWGELELAIKNLKGGRTPGTDGFTGEFYKRFKTQLLERWLDLFKACFELGKLPPSRRQARLVVIPKEGEDWTKPELHKPISLLNVDYKIIVSILVPRLNSFIGECIG